MTDAVEPDGSTEAAATDAASPAPETFPAGDHLVGMAFDKITRADEVLLNLIHLAGEGEITLTDAVVVAKNDNGKVIVKQTVDTTPAQGAMSGSLWGLLIGTIVGGPVGGLVGAGAMAASGGLMAKLIDVGLDDGWAREVAEWLDPGTSALLVLVAHDVGPSVLKELSRFEGHVLYCTFPDSVRRELERALGHGGVPGGTVGSVAGDAAEPA